MPRTAITLAKKHGGPWVLLSGPDVPIQKHLQDFRALLGEKSHSEFEQVRIQESDGVARVINLRSAESQKAHDEARAKEVAANKAAVEKEKQQTEAAVKQKSDVKNEATKAEVAAHSANIERIKADQAASKPEKPATQTNPAKTK